MSKGPKIMLRYKRESLSLKEWSARVGISADCIRRRLDNGWTVEAALTKPVDTARIKVPEVFQARIPGTLEQLPSRSWLTGIQ